MKLAVIGCGNMATALIGGMLDGGVLSAEEVIASDASATQLEAFAKQYGIEAASDNESCVAAADYVLLAVKPQMLSAVAPALASAIPQAAVIVSILAGVDTERLSAAFGGARKVVRVMPNTPALVRAGMSAVCKNELATEEELAVVKTLLTSCGEVIALPERLMDTFSALAGSSPAYVYMLISAMADAAVADGMPYADALTAAAQSVYGSAKMVLQSDAHPEELKARVCSPGGTTIEGVAVLEEYGFRSAIIEALRAATEKAKEL